MVRDRHGVRVGPRQVKPWMPSHVKGVRQGNQRGSIDVDPGFEPTDFGARGTARRSTGIRPQDRTPIDPRMPNLSPS